MIGGNSDSTEAAEGRMGHCEIKGPVGKLTMHSPVFWLLVGGQRGSIIYFCHILPPTQFLLSLQEIYNYNGNKHIGTYNQNEQILGECCLIYLDKNFKKISFFLFNVKTSFNLKMQVPQVSLKMPNRSQSWLLESHRFLPTWLVYKLLSPIKYYIPHKNRKSATHYPLSEN